MKWFTSDTHFGHDRAIEYSRRPFSTVEEMNETLIANWNNVVARGDLVYHLGDFWLGPSARAAEATEIMGRLNGSKHLILGNHDGKVTKSLSGWSWVGHYKNIKVESQRIVLFHYGLRSWQGMHTGAWHLYGHSHGGLPPQGSSFDIGVDCHDYRPLSFEEVSNAMPK